jgi:hypothetical protein
MGEKDMVPISEASLQVLVERIGNAIGDISELKGQIHGFNQLVLSLTSVQKDLENNTASIKRLFEKIEGADGEGGIYRSIAQLDRDVHVSNRFWKVVGVLSIACLGGTGWMITQIFNVTNAWIHMDNRVTTLEFMVGGRNTPAMPLQRPTPADGKP